MLSREKKSELRSKLFRHLDGIVAAPSAYVLYAHGVTQHLLAEGSADLAELSKQFRANDGYLNVALNALANQGWLTVEGTRYTVTETGKIAFHKFGSYEGVNDLLIFSEKFHPRKFEIEPFQALEKLIVAYKELHQKVHQSQDTEYEVRSQMLAHIEGILIGPSIVHLGMSGMFHKYFMESSFKAEEFHRYPDSFETLLDFFSFLGWFTKKNDTYTFTPEGIFYAKRASAYGVTVSYIPTLRKLDQLIFGDINVLQRASQEDKEIHVDRAMNVWGSGGAHSTYFKEVDKILIDIFNQPLDDQPSGLLDMGCGNGAFLIHAFDVIEKQTLRGQHLEDRPLFIVGADYNQEALDISKHNLINADVWAKFIIADIAKPKELADQLASSYGIDLRDLLNFRSFIDHNRPWQYPSQEYNVPGEGHTGAYATEGEYLDHRVVEASLLEHLQRWRPYIDKHGLLVIELHDLAPELIADHLGKTAATAYIATHGYSDQYILSLDRFLVVTEQAGLSPYEKYQKKFPDSPLASISINLFR